MIYEFQATQDLHGYDKPWAPGANDNKALVDSEMMQKPAWYPGAWGGSTPAGDNGMIVTRTAGQGGSGGFTIKDLVAGTYTFSFDKDASSASFHINVYATEDGEAAISIIAGLAPSDGNRIYRTFTLENDVVELAIRPCPGNFNTGYSSAFLDKMMLCAGSDYTYSPYSNICPPEGFNIWDPDNAEYVQVYAGFVNANTRELYLRPWYTEYAGEELVGPWMSSLDPYEEDTTPTEGAFVIDFGGELTSLEITPFMLQTLLDSLGIRQHFTNGAGLLNSLMDQAQGRVRSEEELLHLSRPLKVIAIGDQLPASITFKPISKDVLPGLPGKFIR